VGANSGHSSAGPLAAVAALMTLGPVGAQVAAIGAPGFMAVRGAQDAAKAGAEQVKKMKDATDKSLNDAAQQREDQAAAARTAAARTAARSQQLAGQTGAGTSGFGSTILTSPLGVPTLPSGGGGKTLLGT
jgi:hypothetical protein